MKNSFYTFVLASTFLLACARIAYAETALKPVVSPETSIFFTIKSVMLLDLDRFEIKLIFTSSYGEPDQNPYAVIIDKDHLQGRGEAVAVYSIKEAIGNNYQLKAIRVVSVGKTAFKIVTNDDTGKEKISIFKIQGHNTQAAPGLTIQ